MFFVSLAFTEKHLQILLYNCDTYGKGHVKPFVYIPIWLADFCQKFIVIPYLFVILKRIW